MTPPHGHQFDHDELFVLSVNDLEQRTRLNADSYDLLQVPLLLRRLLFDEAPLMHTVNRERRFTIRFDVFPYRVYAPIGDGHGWLSREYIDPDAGLADMLTTDPTQKQALEMVRSATRSLNLAAFLAFSVVICGDRHATVLDFMRHFAYTGALHSDKPDPDSLIAQLPTYAPHARQNLDPVQQTIVGIGRVVVRALRPLVLAIEGEYTPRTKGDLWIQVEESVTKQWFPELFEMGNDAPADEPKH
jgi:hypothetical protein